MKKKNPDAVYRRPHKATARGLGLLLCRAAFLCCCAAFLFCACGSNKNVSGEDLLQTASGITGLRANMKESITIRSGSGEVQAVYEGRLETGENIRRLEGEFTQDGSVRRIDYYLEYIPDTDPEKCCIRSYAYKVEDDIWNQRDQGGRMGRMISLEEMLDALSSSAPETGTQNVGYTVTGLLPMQELRYYAMTSYTGPTFSTVLALFPEDCLLYAELGFNTVTKLPSFMEFSLAEPVEVAGRKVEAYTIRLDITDCAYAGLEVPEEVRISAV